jgi:hypothetical protein
MHDQEKVFVHREDQPLSDPANVVNRFAVDRLNRWIVRPYDEWANDPKSGKPLPDDAPTQALSICLDVGKFRHGVRGSN